MARFAARATLAALTEVKRLESAVMNIERAAVEAIRGPAGLGALDVYGKIDEQLGMLCDAALFAIRHGLLCAGFDEADLARAASLDAELSSLLAVHLKETIFFWHGPKRHALTKLRDLLAGDHWRSLVVAGPLSLDAVAGNTDPQPLSARGPLPKPLVGPVPAIGIAAGDEECRERCDEEVVQALRQAAKAADGAHNVHLLVRSSSEQTLRNIGDLLTPPYVLPYVSLTLVSCREAADYVPAQNGRSGASRLDASVRAAMKALRLNQLDMLWVPFGAFKKQYWSAVKAVLDQLLKEGLVRAYGVQATVTSSPKTTMVKLLTQRTPQPLAWLTAHDILRPVADDAVGAALDAGATPVAMPPRRIATTLGSQYLEAGVADEQAEREAILHAWSRQRGLAVVLPSRGSVNVFQQLISGDAARRLSVAASRLLDGAHMFARPSTAAETEVASSVGASAIGLAASLARAQQAEGAALAGAAFAVASAQTSTDFAPGVAADTLKGSRDHANQYDDNHNTIYVENFFDNATWDAIVAETKRLWASRDLEANCNLDGKDRLGGYVLDLNSNINSSLYQLIYGNEPFRQWVTTVNGKGDMWPSDFPIELREYPEKSRGMGCHSDLLMYHSQPKDCEFALTVENDSPSVSTYVDKRGVKHKVQTKANSLIMVRANAAVHCVTGTTIGSRQIIKFIYAGDFKKSKDFWRYTDNVCTEDNPNVRALKRRREERSRDFEL